jgi:iron complex outermembrane recepter protein
MRRRRVTAHAIARTGLKSCAALFGCTLAMAVVVPADCHAATPPATNLANASIEDLMNIQVTSVSKKEESLSKVGAAVFVLDSEDIRRSGANNIPDLLRLVPGVNVAQVDGHTWAISIRGFNGIYADKVLVLIDGRSVYSPLTSGVNWDQQDVPLEDIDRIEVIRGPGGTVWGANAVNGVINIMTKQADGSGGGMVVAGGGSHQVARDLAQYQGAIGPNAGYRIFGGYSDTRGSMLPGGSKAADSWHTEHFGARTDWAVSERDNLTIQGDASQTRSGNTPTSGVDADIKSNAADLLGRWTRTFANGSDATLQAYFDHYGRIKETAWDEFRNTFDLDFHHHVKAGSRNDLIWGLGYRVTNYDISGTFVSISPANGTDQFLNAFGQDEIALTRSLSLTLGSKVEHNAYVGVEFEPSVQVTWRPVPHQQVWAAGARALRDPNESDVGLHAILATIPIDERTYGTIEAFGRRGQKSEEVRDFELGYRADLRRNFSFDAAAFTGLWRNLSQVLPGNPYFTKVPEPHLVIPEFLDNVARGHNYGGEIFAEWKVTARWKLIPALSWSNIVLEKAGQGITFTGNSSRNSPRVQFQLRSLMDLTRNIELDNTLFYTGELGDFGAGPVPAYTRLDMRIGRRFGERSEISIVGQNLLSGGHVEFPDEQGVAHVLVPRSVFGRIQFRF